MKQVVRKAGMLLALTIFSMILFTSCGGEDDEILDDVGVEIETEHGQRKKQ